MADLEPTPFELAGAGGVPLRGEQRGEGSPVVLAHGVTAHRNLVLHGSKALPRAGHRTIAYDARGHGESEPGERGSYGYATLADDLLAVIDELAGDVRPVLCGSSMGAHTALALALRAPERVAGVVAIGPASDGTAPDEGGLSGWDELADGLEHGGPEGFIEVYERQGLDPRWSETLVRIARERLDKHRHPDAVAAAMREVARSVPFEGIEALSELEPPALIVASHDEADPGHPYAIAAAYAEAIPSARLISEERGESPLAWQGGKLSREVAAFCERDEVRERQR